MQEQWLRCDVDKGMFSDEVAVTYPSKGLYRKSVFVSKAAVSGDGPNAYVRVVVTIKGGKTYATLPSPQQDIVAVSSNDLSELLR